MIMTAEQRKEYDRLCEEINKLVGELKGLIQPTTAELAIVNEDYRDWNNRELADHITESNWLCPFVDVQELRDSMEEESEKPCAT